MTSREVRARTTNNASSTSTEAIPETLKQWKQFPLKYAYGNNFQPQTKRHTMKLVAISNSFHRGVKNQKILRAKAKDFGRPYGAPDPIVEGGPKYDAAMKGSL
jgi:hypothetical protein